MNQMCRWLLALVFAVPTLGLAETPVDFCNLLQTQVPTKGALTTFVFSHAPYHGQFATSARCPRLSTAVSFSIGNSAKAQNFYTIVFRRPPKLNGIREIQATVDYTGELIIVRRVHAYRELTDSEAALFGPKFSPEEEDILRKALGEAAEAADAAVDR